MSEPPFVSSARGIAAGIAAMAVVVARSNYAVQFALNDWLTWGAFTYPAAFLVPDLTNRTLVPTAARRVIHAGLALAVVLANLRAPHRIAIASARAFLVAPPLDLPH